MLVGESRCLWGSLNVCGGVLDVCGETGESPCVLRGYCLTGIYSSTSRPGPFRACFCAPAQNETNNIEPAFNWRGRYSIGCPYKSLGGVSAGDTIPVASKTLSRLNAISSPCISES